MIIIRISGETLIIILNLKVTLWSKFSKEIWNSVFKHIFYQKVIRDLYGTVLTYNLKLAFSIKISVPCIWIFSAVLYIFLLKSFKRFSNYRGSTRPRCNRKAIWTPLCYVSFIISKRIWKRFRYFVKKFLCFSSEYSDLEINLSSNLIK